MRTVPFIFAFLTSCGVQTLDLGAELEPEESEAELGSKFRRAGRPIAGQYLVMLRDGAALQVAASSDRLTRRHGASLDRSYDGLVPAFFMRASEAQARAMASDPEIAFVEEDGEVEGDAVPWGLDRIDQYALPLSGTFNPGLTGAGVHVYVIDSGLRATHSQFGGRASLDFSTVDDGRGANDCTGHGTHVAGIIGGQSYGVARGVRLHSVRVLGCDNRASWSSVLVALRWIAEHVARPAVVNMSLGGSQSSTVDAAVSALVTQGNIPVVISAMNEASDACRFTPARVGPALTVAATTQTDARASFSNYGPCVDLFAPGVSIPSAYLRSDTDVVTMSGTSMAAPHVTGAAALYLQRSPGASYGAVTQVLTLASSPQVVNPGPSTTNRLLDVAFAASACTPAPELCNGRDDNCNGAPDEGNLCDDANACTADACAGSCLHTPVSCNDGNACTTDSCDPVAGCRHTARSCADGNLCTQDLGCNPASGACSYAPVNCDDGNACTADSCAAATGCRHTPWTRSVGWSGHRSGTTVASGVAQLGCGVGPTPVFSTPLCNIVLRCELRLSAAATPEVRASVSYSCSGQAGVAWGPWVGSGQSWAVGPGIYSNVSGQCHLR